MENIKKWQRAELLIFTVLTFINMMPFVATRFFPSMDGASHLSNSNIINQLVFYHNNLFSQFFAINPEPVPNWTAHLMISLLTLVMPAFLAEKILILVLLIGTPFAFRSLVQTVSPKQTLFSFLIFPFTHSMFFFFGFFNFCIAVMLFLVTLNYWLRHEHQALKFRQTITLILLVSLTYFSHIVIFGTLLIIMAMHIITRATMDILCKKNEKKIIFRQLFKKVMTITIAALIPTVLFVYFFYSRPGIREVTYTGLSELFNFLVTVRPLISLNVSIEGKFTVILFYMFVALVAIGALAFLIRIIRSIIKKSDPEHQNDEPLLPRFNFWWLLVSMAVLLLLYFRLPEAYGTASYTNLRIGFVFFLVTIVWISTFRIPWYFGLMAAFTGLCVNTLLIRYYTPGINDLGKLAVSCNKAADFVAPNSLVLPIYCMDNWFTGHFVDYIAVDKPIVMVYNYECASGYFPVIWNENQKPDYYLGNPSVPEKFINFELTKGNPSLKLDYVFIVGQYDTNKDWFFSTLHKILTDDFVRVYEAENCSLYRNKLSTAK